MFSAHGDDGALNARLFNRERCRSVRKVQHTPVGLGDAYSSRAFAECYPVSDYFAQQSTLGGRKPATKNARIHMQFFARPLYADAFLRLLPIIVVPDFYGDVTAFPWLELHREIQQHPFYGAIRPHCHDPALRRYLRTVRTQQMNLPDGGYRTSRERHAYRDRPFLPVVV
ncbi:MAG: hypothetical protein BWY06_02753 [Candidatus Latescibacteria bacterium ADurb.Bin168]|nr:MAG: hypothetical protein BWY06_02753 [Candidatus Latescibacteria bacterium ADurb.Bin168]